MSEIKEHRFIKDLKEGEKVISVYLLREKTSGLTKKGDFYASLELVDRTGKVDAKVWDASEAFYKKLLVDKFLGIEGSVDFFKGYPQIKVTSCRPLNEEEEKTVKLENYLPVSPFNTGKMYNELQEIIAGIKNPFCRKLLENIFANEKFTEVFKKCPAATDFHHPYLGGLLEHSLSLVKLAKAIINHYPNAVNEELLLTCCILHDIGKTEELSYERSFNYTDRGKFIGHIVIGAGIIEKKISEITGFPGELRDLILHLILSHHGEYEWGSPRRPKCLEAVMLHHIDNIDAKVNGFHWFTNSYTVDNDSSWTNYSKMFAEYLYKDSKKFEINLK
ncbi:MAG: HD domain-containing protein [bacterium]|nr:HD domain-containing protein [bacterium]